MSTNEITIAGKKVYVTATGVKLTSKGKVVTTRELVSGLVKGERRRVRKSLRAMGYVRHAGM